MASPADSAQTIDDFTDGEYKYGFVTDIEAETIPLGLSEDTVRFISAKKNEPEWLLEWRLGAYRHWLTMTEPHWAKLYYPPIDYQASSYYSAPKSLVRKSVVQGKSVDPGGRRIIKKKT